MRYSNTMLRNFVLGSLLVSSFGVAATAQLNGRMTVQATAMGTSTQMGRTVDITIIIEQLSTPEDQKALMEAFKSRGQDGMVNVLQDMKSKGRVRFSSGGVGNDVKYIIQLPSDKGRRFRLVTDRDLSFAEQYSMTRRESYDVGAIEFTVMPDGKGTGTVLPACRLTIDKKKKQLEIETYQNPWNLINFRVSND